MALKSLTPFAPAPKTMIESLQDIRVPTVAELTAQWEQVPQVSEIILKFEKCNIPKVVQKHSARVAAGTFNLEAAVAELQQAWPLDAKTTIILGLLLDLVLVFIFVCICKCGSRPAASKSCCADKCCPGAPSSVGEAPEVKQQKDESGEPNSEQDQSTRADGSMTDEVPTPARNNPADPADPAAPTDDQ